MPYIPKELKHINLTAIQQKKGSLTILDLSNFGLSFEIPSDIQAIREIIKDNSGLEEIYLSNNDLRNRLCEIFDDLQSCPNLRVLDIVDNNIEDKIVCESLAKLIKNNSKLTEIYIGAKFIMGSTNGRHVYFDEALEKQERLAGHKLYHNTCLPSGYYGTGFNEVDDLSLSVLSNALETRFKNTPVTICHLFSKLRTYTQISKTDDKYSFNREYPDKASDKIRKSQLQSLKYDHEFYEQDDYCCKAFASFLGSPVITMHTSLHISAN